MSSSHRPLNLSSYHPTYFSHYPTHSLNHSNPHSSCRLLRHPTHLISHSTSCMEERERMERIEKSENRCRNMEFASIASRMFINHREWWWYEGGIGSCRIWIWKCNKRYQPLVGFKNPSASPRGCLVSPLIVSKTRDLAWELCKFVMSNQKCWVFITKTW